MGERADAADPARTRGPGTPASSRAILASDWGRIAGPPRPPDETQPSTLTSKSSVSGSTSGSDGNVFDDEIASAPPQERGLGLLHDVRRRGRQLDPDGDRATAFTAWVETEHRTGSLPTFGAHVHAVHVRAREVELDRVDAGVLDALDQRLPVPELLVVARARP